MTAEDTLLMDRGAIIWVLKEHMTQSQHRTKQLADKHSTEKHFDVGD